MILDELSYATVKEIEPKIVEVIAHKGVEITKEDMDLMEKGFLEKYGERYCELVNRINEYSHTHASMEIATNLKNCAAVAILVHSKNSKAIADLHTVYSDNVQVFMDRDEALVWLRAELKESI